MECSATVFAAISTFMAALFSKADRFNTGTENPQRSQTGMDPGNRSGGVPMFTINRRSAFPAAGIWTMPIPRTSIFPAIFAACLNMGTPDIVSTITRSSQISTAPRSISLSAKSDFPLPDGPIMRMPWPPMQIAVAWILSHLPFTVTLPALLQGTGWRFRSRRLVFHLRGHGH
jgi:hypothetical protein